MRVLVTGGCGLIGYHTCKYFHDKGDYVVSIDNFERSKLLGHEVSDKRLYYNKHALEKMGIQNWPWDVSNPENWEGIRARERFDAVIHLAGQCGVPTSIADPRRDFEVNTVGTLNALEYCRKTGATLVLASTNKVYPLHSGFLYSPEFKKWMFAMHEWDWHGFPVTNELTGARTPYGNSKMAADLLCQEWSHTYGVRTGVFRMSCIYGPHQMGFEEQGWAVWFLIAAMKGLPITVFGDGHQVRDMLYVEDCVNAYSSFVSSSVVHGVWNLGGGPSQTITLDQHLDITERITGKRSPVTYADWRPLDQKCYVSDIRKIKEDLGWEPKVGVEEGLTRSAEWVEKNLEVF